MWELQCNPSGTPKHGCVSKWCLNIAQALFLACIYFYPPCPLFEYTHAPLFLLLVFLKPKCSVRSYLPKEGMGEIPLSCLAFPGHLPHLQRYLLGSVLQSNRDPTSCLVPDHHCWGSKGRRGRPHPLSLLALAFRHCRWPRFVRGRGKDRQKVLGPSDTQPLGDTFERTRCQTIEIPSAETKKQTNKK